jgi:hypothetical protein
MTMMLPLMNMVLHVINVFSLLELFSFVYLFSLYFSLNRFVKTTKMGSFEGFAQGHKAL